MKTIWLALLFFAGGVSHEIRNPIGCHCIATRQATRLGTRPRIGGSPSAKLSV